MPARTQDLQQPGLQEEPRGEQDHVGPESVRGGQDRVESEPGGLVAVQVLPYLVAAARADLSGFGEGIVVEPQGRVKRVFLDGLPEPGQGL